MNKNKKNILEAAVEIFSASGYSGASMDNIAEKAGVAKGTLYYNFSSKEDIFNSIIKIGIKNLMNDIYKIKNSKIEMKEKLKEICNIQLQFFYKNKNFVNVVLSQLWGKEKRQKQLRILIKEYIENIKSIIDDGMKSGIINEDDSLILSHMFFGILTSTAIYDCINNDTECMDKVLDINLRYILNAIKTSNV